MGSWPSVPRGVQSLSEVEQSVPMVEVVGAVGQVVISPEGRHATCRDATCQVQPPLYDHATPEAHTNTRLLTVISFLKHHYIVHKYS